jgi:hypothetical protein
LTRQPAAPVWRVLTESRILGSWLVTIMTLPAYDILKKNDNNFVWVDAAHDIQSAKKRVYELSRHGDAEFVIFNEHTLQVVATFETPISF